MMKKHATSSQSADILTFLEERAGLVFPQTRMADVERGIARAAARSGAPDVQCLLANLRQSAALLEEFLAGLLIGETYFFREPKQFDAIRQMVLPALMCERPLDAPLQIWSAGCSTGEEPFSLAILLEEEGLGGQSHIIASDVCAPALKKATRGSYEPWSLRGAKKEFTRTYFEERGRKFQLIDRIRERVAFTPGNLASPVYPRPQRGKGFDLILCRNVLIYFGRETVSQVAKKLFDSLSDGGWLVTAPSDPPLWDFAPYETKATAAGVFYRKTGAPAGKRKAPVRIAPQPVPASATPKPKNGKTPVSVARKDAPAFCSDRAACEVHAQALFQGNRPDTALTFLSRAVAWHPLSAELLYLYAIGLLNGNKLDKAAEAARRLAYLDPQSVAAQMLMGTIARQRGDRAGAMRAYRNGFSLCADAGEDEIVPLTGTERYGRVAAALAAEIAFLQSAEAVS
jgi:chemotaxis protein methyltransferase CheR